MGTLRNWPKLALATGLLFSGTAVLSQSEESAQGDLSVTIYNNDQALVQDVRQLAIGAGCLAHHKPFLSGQQRVA